MLVYFAVLVNPDFTAKESERLRGRESAKPEGGGGSGQGGEGDGEGNSGGGPGSRN